MLSPQLASQSTAPLCHAIVEEAVTAQPATHPLLDMRSNLRDVDARGAKGAPPFEVRMGYRYDDPRIDRRPRIDPRVEPPRSASAPRLPLRAAPERPRSGVETSARLLRVISRHFSPFLPRTDHSSTLSTCSPDAA